MNCSNARCLIEPAPARFCHRGDAPAPSGRGLSLSRASLASLNAFLFLPAFARHCASCPRPSTAPAAADSEAGRRAGEARPKGKSRKRTEESSLSSGRFRLFPAAGRPGPPSHSTQSAFTAKHRFFVSFLAQERNVPLPPVPHTKQQPHASLLRHAAVFLQKTLSWPEYRPPRWGSPWACGQSPHCGC